MHTESTNGGSSGSARYSDLDRPGLDVFALRRALCPPAGPFSSIDVIAETPSTNEALAEKAVDSSDLSVLTADFQSAGAGRRGRGWTAPPRSSVLVSVLLRPGESAWTPDAYGWLPLLGGLAVTESLRAVAGLETGVKWPNDVLAGPAEKKLAGVLARAVTIGSETAVVLGAGVNVSLAADELPVDTATSVRLAGGTTTDRDTILRAYLRRLAYWYAAMRDADGDAGSAGLAAAVRENTLTLGRTVSAELPGGERLTGSARAIDDAGRLVIAAADDTHHVSAGDVLHLRAGER